MNLDNLKEALVGNDWDSTLILIRWSRAAGLRSYIRCQDSEVFEKFCEELPNQTNLILFRDFPPNARFEAKSTEPVEDALKLLPGEEWLLLEDCHLQHSARPENESMDSIRAKLPNYVEGEYSYELKEALTELSGKSVLFYQRAPIVDQDPLLEHFIGEQVGVY